MLAAVVPGEAGGVLAAVAVLVAGAGCVAGDEAGGGAGLADGRGGRYVLAGGGVYTGELRCVRGGVRVTRGCPAVLAGACPRAVLAGVLAAGTGVTETSCQAAIPPTPAARANASTRARISQPPAGRHVSRHRMTPLMA